MPNTKPHFLTPIIYILIIYIFVFLMISPEIATSSCQKALELCFFRVIPVLFPFMVVNDLIISSGIAELLGKLFGKIFSKLFHISQISSVSFLSGCLFGFPIGAKSAISLYEKGYIDKKETERLICFCSNTGPGFVINIIGGVFHNNSIATVIYFSQIISAVIIGIITRKKSSFSSKLQTKQNDKPFLSFSSLPTAITNAVIPTLNICAFVCFFSVITQSVDNLLSFFNLGTYSSIFLAGLLEITNGIASLSNVPINSTSIFLSSFFVGCSGLSVCLQTISLTSKTNIKTGKFFVSKLFQGILCALFSVIICKNMNLY